MNSWIISLLMTLDWESSQFSL